MRSSFPGGAYYQTKRKKEMQENKCKKCGTAMLEGYFATRTIKRLCENCLERTVHDSSKMTQFEANNLLKRQGEKVNIPLTTSLEVAIKLAKTRIKAKARGTK